MARLTQKELGSIGELLHLEAMMYEKFRFYATSSPQEHVQKLCDQLADRSREHLTALASLVNTEHTSNLAHFS